MTTDTRDRVDITNGTLINLKLIIDDVASFNRYVIKEHGNAMQGEDVFGKLPATNCVVNCLYDELSGWLDNPSILGLTVLGISFNKNKIEEDNSLTPIDPFALIRFIKAVASKDHTLEEAQGGAAAQLTHLREQARELLKELIQTERT
jgi:hypothetical protein